MTTCDREPLPCTFRPQTFIKTPSLVTAQYCAAAAIIKPLFIEPLTFLESATYCSEENFILPRQIRRVVYKERFPETLAPHNTAQSH